MLRGIGLVWLLLFLLWLPVEETRVGFSIALSALGAFWLLLRFLGRSRVNRWLFASFGALAGLATIMGAIGLFAFKSGLHAHGFSDITMAQVLDILAQIPLAAIIGAGLGFLLASYAST